MTEHELFKEAVMQNFIDDAHVKRESKRHRAHPVARKILFTAACLLVAAGVTVFSIPSARAAVEDWLSGLFSVSDYFGQKEEEREKEPKIEAIITKANEKKAVVTSIGAGFEAYADAFDLTLDEIAYDGESIYLSGTMSGETARPFVQVHTGGDTFRAGKNDGSLGGNADQEYYFFECENYFMLTIGEGTYSGNIVASITDDMEEIFEASLNTPMTVTEQDGVLVAASEKVDALWDAYLAEHDIRFSVELLPSYIWMQPLTGIVQGDLSLRLFYGNVEGADSTPVLDADFGKIAIDANAYQQQTQTTQAGDGTRIELSGIHPVTITEWQPEAERTSDDCETYHYTRELDFTGASYTLKEISFTPTDTKITLHIVLPESWSDVELANVSLYFHFLFDGQNLDFDSFIPFNASGPYQTYDQTGNTHEFDCTFSESTIPPSQWETIQTLTLIPATEYVWDMKVSFDDGPQTDFSLRDGAVYTGIVNHTRYEYDALYDEMTQFALEIQLDDFR